MTTSTYIMTTNLGGEFGVLRFPTIDDPFNLGGGFKYFLFSSLFGEMIQFD